MRNCLGAILFMAVTAASAQAAAPYLPAVDGEVLEKVPAASDPAVRRIAALRRALASEPGDPRAADALARAYIDFGRKVGDAHYAGYAEAVIAPWLARPAAPPALLVTQATLLQYRHEFGEARALLLRAVRADPVLAQAWLSLAALDTLQGDHAAAAGHCGQAGRHGGRDVGLACRAGVHLVSGEAQRGLSLLAQVGSTSLGAWVEGLRAEGNERLGRWREAEAHYRKALDLAPGDNYLLCGYADLLLDRGRPKEVVALLSEYAESDTTYLRLALAHVALGSPQAASYRFATAGRFEAYRIRQSELFGREEARFLLYLAEDPDAALTAAQRNFERQREPADVRILLEAARAAGNAGTAAPAIAFVERTRLEDPAIAAVIRDLRGAP